MKKKELSHKMRYATEKSPTVPVGGAKSSTLTYENARSGLQFLPMEIVLGPTLGRGPSEQVGVSSAREATF